MMTHMTPQLSDALQIVGDGPTHPEFDAAWACLALSDHQEIRAAMRLALEETFGPYPPPTGYSDSGEPYWETAIMAKYLDIPLDQIDTTVLELREKWGEAVGVVETEKLHRVH
ncbi:MAG: hypothetical protein HQL80_07895 [Magnetococcales bacterium]|nr:hypothetical protein [Magnetococcales bacterium]